MKKYIVILAIAALGLQSCSLDEHPESFPNRESFYQTETQCIAAMNACYLPLSKLFTSSMILMTEACSDIWYSSSSTVDSICDVTPAKPQFGTTMWTQAYIGIMRCNECIECIGKSNLAEDKKNQLIAEARVLRGTFYYFLTCTFNGVPYYEYMITDDEVLQKVRTLPRTDASVIRDNVYNDLRDNAIPFFTPESGLRVRGSEAPSHRAGYALGLMIMAKCALWNQNWDAALVPLKALEELYGEFSEERYPLRDIMWRFKNTAESIFEIQHDYSVDGVQYAGNVGRMMMPKYNGTNEKPDLYNGVSIPSLGSDGTAWNACRTNNQFAIFRPATSTSKTENTSYTDAMFNPLPLTYSDEYYTSSGRYYVTFDLEAMRTGVSSRTGEKIDRRVYYKLGMGNLDSLILLGIVPKSAEGKVFTITKQGGYSWCGPQFWCPDMIKSNDSNNYKIFRYADALLMMAECYIGLEDAERAMYYINKIRERAGVDEITNFTGFEALTSVLRCERARELCGEFQRKFDLVRWGVWFEQTYANTGNSNLKNRMQRCHRYYPIPDTECALSGYVLTNDEYVAEGM